MGSVGKLLVDNVDATISSRASQTSLDTVDDFLDTEVGAIKAKTDNLPADPADASDIAAAFAVTNGKIDVVDDFLDTEIAAIKAKTDNLPSDPADASVIAGRFDTLDTSIADLPTNAELATALGTADDAVLSAIGALNNLSAAQVNAEVDTALADYDGPTHAELTAELAAADDAVLAQVALVKAKTDGLPSDPADASVIAGRFDTLDTSIGDLPTNAELATALAGADDAVLAAIAALTIPSASANASALLAAAFEGAETVQDFLRLSRAVLYGESDGQATGTVHYRDKADTKNRVTGTVDVDGNRSAVVLIAS
jgi:hypothetical protein